MSNNDNINNSLGIGPLDPQPSSTALAILKNELRQDSATKDFEYARNKMQSVLEVGILAIEELNTVAVQSQNPRAYEVVAKLIDAISMGSERLLTLQEKIRNIEKANEAVNKEANNVPGGQTTITNNTLFVGSTNDLLRQILSIKKDDLIIDAQVTEIKANE